MTAGGPDARRPSPRGSVTPKLWSTLSALLSLSAAVAEETPTAQEIGSVRVYLTAVQARSKIFPQAEYHEASNAAARSLDGDHGEGTSSFAADSLRLYIAYARDGKLLGYTVILNKIGKFRPITFMVGVTPDFGVKDVAILVYRESRGGQVRRARFLRQYRGKTASDPIRINRDIINITGATLSVRALNHGIRKAVRLTEKRYRTPSTP